MKRDELKLGDLLPKTGRNIADRRRATSGIIKDIYGSKVDNYYEYGLAESIDSEEFDVKLESLKDRWEWFCPGFFNWFVARRKLLFSESVIQSARANTDIKGLFYQNDIKSLHAKQKRNQNFKTETVAAEISNIQNIIQREQNDEIRAIYGAGNYVLSPEYKKFQVPSHMAFVE